MSAERSDSLEVLRQRSDLEIVLVTEENIGEYLLDSDPLPEEFFFLSATHKSDFLRSYFMFHHGGAYSDVKPYSFQWSRHLERLERSNRAFIGQRQTKLRGLSVRARMPHWNYVCDSYFAFKPHTAFALEWKKRVNERVGFHSDQLKKNPGTYHPRATRSGIMGVPPGSQIGSEPRGYPFGWMDLQGKIFHPLQYEFRGTFLRGLPQQAFAEKVYR